MHTLYESLSDFKHICTIKFDTDEFYLNLTKLDDIIIN